ncbi:OB-fold domain-containing protein [Candidatus Gottesmanbacteria bacterium]|nr:OB-fold domain-containing protein [Candidatus Gottesmanbacteria bacterium]
MQSPVKIWRNQKKITNLLGKPGKIISWTIVRTPPAQFVDQAPYGVVLVELEDGGRLTAQLVDWQPKHLKIGQRVTTVVRRVTSPNSDDVIPYGIKVKPL